jgi:hypothetical protein
MLMALGAVVVWAVFAVLVGPKLIKKWSTVSTAKELVARDLKDPSSAQFRNVKRGERAVCGEVNAKNSYGAYIGFRHFYVESGEASIEPGLPDERLAPGVGPQTLQQWEDQISFRSLWLSRCDTPLPVLPASLEPALPDLKQ